MHPLVSPSRKWGLRLAWLRMDSAPRVLVHSSDDDNFGYWMDVKARQMSESVRRLRKQVLTGGYTGS